MKNMNDTEIIINDIADSLKTKNRTGFKNSMAILFTNTTLDERMQFATMLYDKLTERTTK